MIVEILFSELCNFYGDPQNAEYLRQTLPDAQFICTGFRDTPFFASEKPDILYMGSMSENTQRRVLEKLRPLRARLQALCDAGCVMLFTGSAADIFCRRIDYVSEGLSAEGLCFFDIDVKTDWFRRVNGKVIGDADGNLVTGFRSQFAEYSGDNSGFAFLNVERGFGLAPGSPYEGMRRNNLICTQLLGPILPLNPDFTSYLIRFAGGEAVPAFYPEMKEAYDRRVAEFRNPDTKF